MSLDIALQSAQSALSVSQKKLSVASQNIANLNTKGYTRKTVQVEASSIGGIGLGVEVKDIQRHVDTFLVQEMQNLLPQLGSLEAQSEWLMKIQDLYGAPDRGLTTTDELAQWMSAIKDLGDASGSKSLRGQFVLETQTLLKNINNVADTVQKLRLECDHEIAKEITAINTQLDLIATINKQIIRAKADKQSTAELEDQRQQAIERVATALAIQTINNTDASGQPDGSISVVTPTGKTLADTRSYPLSHEVIPNIQMDTTFSGGQIKGIYIGAATPSNEITLEIKQGKIHGLIEMRDHTLPKYSHDIEKFSISIKETANRVHNRGTSDQPPKILQGTRYFSNPATDSVTLSHGARFALVDSQGHFSDSFDLTAGTYTINAIASAINSNLTGVTASTASNRLDISHATLGIAIADLGNQTVTFGAQNYAGTSYFFGLNDLIVDYTNTLNTATVSGSMRVRSDIEATPSLVSHGKLNEAVGVSAGTPAIGQRDGRIMDELLIALRANQTIQGTTTFTSAGTSPFVRTLQGNFGDTEISLDRFSSAITGLVTQKTASIQNEMAVRQSYYDAVKFRADSKSGVNLDEELGNLMLFQKAFSASARVIKVSQSLFDELLNMTS